MLSWDAPWPVVPPLQMPWVWLLLRWLHLAGAQLGVLAGSLLVSTPKENGFLATRLLGQRAMEWKQRHARPLNGCTPHRHSFSAGQSKSCSWLRWRKMASLRFRKKQRGKYVLGRKLYYWRPVYPFNLVWASCDTGQQWQMNMVHGMPFLGLGQKLISVQRLCCEVYEVKCIKLLQSSVAGKYKIAISQLVQRCLCYSIFCCLVVLELWSSKRSYLAESSADWGFASLGRAQHIVIYYGWILSPKPNPQ